MLHFVTNHQTKDEKEFSWAIGQQSPIQSTDLIDVSLVRADGKELEFIKQNCKEVNFGNNKIAKVTGSDALTVAMCFLAKV